MSINTKWKKGTALLMTLCLTAGGAMGLAGCKSKQESASSQAVSGEEVRAEASGEQKAMGRYLEEEVKLPEGCRMVRSLSIPKKGEMRIIYRGGEDDTLHVAESKDDGTSWKETIALDKVLGTSQKEGDPITLATAQFQDGSLFAVTVKFEDNGSANGIPESNYFYISPEGSAKKLDMADMLGDAYVYDCKITELGTVLLISTGEEGLMEINPQTGELVNEYEKDSYIEGCGLAGHILVLITGGELHCYDLRTGKPLEEDYMALNQEIASNPQNLQLTSTSSSALVFGKGDEDNSLFYADSEGLYRYALNGSVVEQVIDGSLNSISSPAIQFVDMAQDENGAFYLVVEDGSAAEMLQGKILKYVYSEDTPTVPDTELKVYSLSDSPVLRQAAVVFQKKHPNIYLNLESGMTGEDAVTDTDALKALNTEIMAGKGPDIVILDGIPEDTYIEKGMLEDLTGVLKDTELLDNIRNAYEEDDGSIYCLPMKFGIPVIVGEKEDVESVTDLTSLADVIESHKDEYSADKFPLQSAMAPGTLLQSMAETSSPVWVKKDGTLDEGKVKEYLEQTNRIYQAGKAALKEMSVKYGDFGVPQYSRAEWGIGGQSVSVFTHNILFGAGGLFSPSEFAMMDSGKNKDETLGYKLFDGQAKNCFFPQVTVGISSKSGEKDAAEEFVRFLFGEEGQNIGQNEGLPVNRAVYENSSYWNLGKSGRALSVMSSSRVDDSGKELENYILEVISPSAESIKEMQELGKTLTVPARINKIVSDAITSAGERYLSGEIKLDDAVSAAVAEVNLYLSE